ncbi:MAG: FxsA family protein [Planctomycetota bacterium]|jgi:UPF0716 protein FxsA
MLIKLLFLFTVVPILELALLLQMGKWIGVWPTVGIVLATGFAGAVLAQWAGASVLRRIRQEISQGKLPSDGLMEGALVLAGGALLLTPGILTDILGFSLLIPMTRALYREALKRSFKRRIHSMTSGMGIISVNPTGAKNVDSPDGE